MSCLHVRGLTVDFPTPTGLLRAVDGVDLDHRAGEVLSLIGETGCGKSVVASAVMGLLPPNAIVGGRVEFLGRDLLALSDRQMAGVRGREIGLILQNPALALNPVRRVGAQIGEPLEIHRGMKRRETRGPVAQWLRRLGFSDVERHLDAFPFQLSGGMGQRALIAAAMILSPRLLIADEPTKGLDEALRGTVRAELERIRSVAGSSLLLITHDLGLARGISDRVVVMYGGQVMETGPAEDLFRAPLHPYAAALMASLPQNGFRPIPGPPLEMTDPPDGCRFHPRCPEAGEECRRGRVDPGASGERTVRCLRRF